MTIRAIIGDANMIHHRSGKVDEPLRMTGLARQAGRYVIGGLGYRGNASEHLARVARYTFVDNANVIHRCPGKISEFTCRMAALARQAARHMVVRLGYRCHAGKYLARMASCAAVEDARVNHHRTGETRELTRRMTILACRNSW